MNIGVIGTGNMGSILIEALIDVGAITPSQLWITNRTPEKAELLKNKYPGIRVGNIKDVIRNGELVLLCVKPLDMHGILSRYGAAFRKEQCLVSITSPVTVEQLASVVPCSCARAIPSITNRALAGAVLLTFGSQCTDGWRKKLTALFSKISKPIEIGQQITRVASDLVSCGPAFFSFLAQKMVEGAVNKTNIDRGTATVLTAEMLVGVGELLKQNFYTLPALQEKVTVKGGITGEGIKVLEKETDGMFEKLFEATHEKFKEDMEAVARQFGI
ncbi:pyrroline-5-carboxylate reductase [Weizmannia acidilactici]|uniref:Pyrroline-5-carboxylate reductase n=1 Tax=Weizmannia acidilactici TaxID=2607726 RepID=A0A5J4JGJ4_9BACI|nr:late competence protein ComER [Weizmannia acidilactici]GER66963.1 pyrroline-5-carboxylate reductase [Weizmannia acidilactici]GER69617.1 pyrroline-5-carboxylate reductase [Weizmannia acidilactici]GER72706.1 pyrroline-5-carboxylate reductase [Weizmannia acidilactici]